MIYITIFSLALLAVGFIWLMRDLNKPNQIEKELGAISSSAILEVEGRQILVELAADDYSITRGLSYRESLDADRGMYFMFSSSSVQYFWMYQMKFPLDIIFIQDDVVVSVSSNVPNPTGLKPPAIVNSKVPANRVLEINAGKAKEWGIKEGSKVGLVGIGK